MTPSNFYNSYPSDGEYIKNIPKIIRDVSQQIVESQIVDAGTLGGLSKDKFALTDHTHKELQIEHVAGQIIPAFKVVYIMSHNMAGIADAMNMDIAERIIGISLNSVIPGDIITVRTFGTVENGNWNLIPGHPYYLISNGDISPTPEINGFDQKVGIAITDTCLFVQIGTQAQSANPNSVEDIDMGEF